MSSSNSEEKGNAKRHMITRAVYRAIAIPGTQIPYDRASLKIYYPADLTNAGHSTGFVPPVRGEDRFPIVIMLPGVNAGPESYHWLAKALAEQRLVTVTLTFVAEVMPGLIGLSPGLSPAGLAPDVINKTPSAIIIKPILDELAAMNMEGVLAGRLDLDRIILGGHSAGGTAALLNNRADWFPGVRGAFSYGAHTAAARILGYPENSFFPTPTQLPVLIMGGTRDGIIANSNGRYSDDRPSSTVRIERTFDEALAGNTADCALALIEGANHYSMTFPSDDTTGRAFIDFSTTKADEDIRELLLSLISAFIAGYARDDWSARIRLRQLLEQEGALIARGELREGSSE